jgi:hypothetical protein
MNARQLEAIRQLGELGCYAAMDTKLCKAAYDEIMRLRGLLRPFAALLQDHNCEGPHDQPIFQINDATITLGDLRRAFAATEPKAETPTTGETA